MEIYGLTKTPNAKLRCRRDSGGQLERWVRLGCFSIDGHLNTKPTLLHLADLNICIPWVFLQDARISIIDSDQLCSFGKHA